MGTLQIYKHLFCTIEVKGYDEDTAYKITSRWRIDNLSDKTVDDTLFTETEKLSDSHFLFRVFDFYVVKSLKFFQLLRHYIRKSLTTVLRYVGICTPIIIIENDACLPMMQRT